MSYEYHREEYKGHTIIIEQDEDGMNPRTEWDNLGTMVFFHRNYTADKHDFSDTDDMLAHLAGFHIDDLEWEEFRVDADGVRLPNSNKKPLEYGTYSLDTFYKHKGRWLTEEQVLTAIRKAAFENATILPVAMLEHSGVTIWVGNKAHDCDYGGWDSGQVGWIYCEKKKLLDEFNANQKKKVKNITAKAREYGERVLTGEVKTFDDYLQGNVFGYVVEKDGEHTDSCWGFYPNHEYHKDDWDYCLREARSIVDYNVEAANKSHFKQLKTWIKAKVALIYRQPLSI